MPTHSVLCKSTEKEKEVDAGQEEEALRRAFAMKMDTLDERLASARRKAELRQQLVREKGKRDSRVCFVVCALWSLVLSAYM